MATSQVHDDRIRRLDDADEGRQPDGDGVHVLYWMQASGRAEHNDALEYAVQTANDHAVPLHVVFGLTADYPQASARHHRFLLEGLADVSTALERRGIPFAVRSGEPVDVAVDAAAGAVEVVVDRGYLRHLVAWREELVARTSVPVWQVEGDVVVPVEVASDKREYAARTIRPKIERHREDFLVELTTTPLDHTGEPLDGIDLTDIGGVLAELGLEDPGPGVVQGGTSRARARLDDFLQHGLAGYGERRPDPADDVHSFQSTFLQYGQVSPVWLALQVRDSGIGSEDDRATWLEELVVRRELAHNYVVFEPGYDRYAALPDWARRTLEEHRADEREHVYSYEQLRLGRTHDRAWNACQAQVREEGFLHNHLRMYWGKQVVLWAGSGQAAFEQLLRLNNEHFLDGRSPNSFANVAWIFGLHDRPWQETPIRGTTRPMTRSGLESKIGKRKLEAWMAAVEQRHGLLEGE